MTIAPRSAKPIPGWPEYAVTRSGVVWRIAPCPRADNRKDRQAAPRVLVWKTVGGAVHHRHAGVTLCRPGVRKTRTVRAILRETFGAKVAGAFREGVRL